jgi:hydrogenase maturation protein HypF
LQVCALQGEEPARIEVAPLIRSVVTDIGHGVRPQTIAARFHNSLADMVAEVCCRLRHESGLSTVVLSGGVFQNTLLLSRTIARLRHESFDTLIHRQVPCNDGGIALGQAAVAAHNSIMRR